MIDDWDIWGRVKNPVDPIYYLFAVAGCAYVLGIVTHIWMQAFLHWELRRRRVAEFARRKRGPGHVV